MYSFYSICFAISIAICINIIVYNEGTEATEILVLGPRPPANPNLMEKLESTSKVRHHADLTNRNPENSGLCLNSKRKVRHYNRRKRKSNCSCRRILCPVCGSDGVSYNNVCQFNCSKSRAEGTIIAHNGRCRNKNEAKRHKHTDV